METVDVNRIVVLDEMGINRGIERLGGWGKVGERVEDTKPCNPGKNISVVGALRIYGMVVALAVEGAVDGIAFLRFIEKILLPQLQLGDFVVMDNAKTHKSDKIKELIESVGARIVFLPAYSPDFSPIELCWSKIKSILVKTAARTKNKLIAVLRDALSQISHDNAEGWFEYCGYNLQ